MVWPDEQEREHKVSKGEPVGSIRQKRIARIGFGERVIDARDPGQQDDGAESAQR